MKNKLSELEKEKELNKKQTEINFNKLKTDTEKYYSQKAKEEEKIYREIVSTLNLKNSTEIHKKDQEIQKIKHELETISKDNEIKNMNVIQKIQNELRRDSKI